MTIIDRLGSAITTKLHNMERPPAVAEGVTNFGGGMASSGQLAQMSTYGQVSSVFAAVSKISESVASVEWHLYRGPGRSNEVLDHPALQLWNTISPFDTRSDFLETSQQHFELTGEMWWVLVRNPRGLPVELWAVRPDRMQPIKSHDDYILGYVYTLGSERIPLDVNDVIFTRHPNPLDPYRGMSPISALITDLGSEQEAANYNRAFFRNDATPGGIIEAERSMGKTDFDRMIARWRDFHQGTNNAGRIGFLERAHFVERKYTQRDMQYVQLRDRTRDQVLSAYGVPLTMLGVMEAPSRANAQASEYIFARWTITPRLNRAKLALNQKLLVNNYPDRGLHFEYDDPTPNHRELDLEYGTRGYDAGILKLNESRALLGQDEIPEGDAFKAPPPSSPNDGTAGLPSMGELSATGLRKRVYALGEGITKLTPEELKLEIAENAIRLGWTRRFKTELDSLNAYLEENATAEGVGVQLLIYTPTIKIELTALEGYDWDWWAKYKDEVIAELSGAMRLAIVAEFPDISEVTADELAVAYAERRGARLLRIDGDLNLVIAARARVNELVARTLANGDSLGTLQKALREDLAFSPEKARTVARTETATALGQGAKEGALAQDFNQKRWVTQGDDVVDANGTETPCLIAEAQGWIKISDPFASGFDTIPAHPNCRCNVIYRRADADDERSLSGFPKCLKCGKFDTVVPNRDGVGFFCRRCNVGIAANVVK